MNNTQKVMTAAGANLLALGMTTIDALSPQNHQSVSETSRHSVQMNDAQLRAIEASHLEVYAGCKWGHAAFDPVKVENELLTPEVQALYEVMA